MLEYYPVTLWNWDGRFIVCSSKAHREALGAGWRETLQEAKAVHDTEPPIEAPKAKQKNANS